MAKVRALLVDDNEFLATVLTDLLTMYHPEVEILGTAINGRDGLEKIKKLQPNLVFLDVEMPDMTGFEMLNRLGEINFQTIFTTSHSHYAIKAFRFNALDYLVKPVDAGELAEAIMRFKMLSKSGGNRALIQQALRNLHEKKVEDQKLVLQTQKGPLSMALKQIRMIEGERNYSFIHLLDDSRELSSKTLAYFESVLAEKGFFRCHRSYLVNRLHIDRIASGKFILTDGTEVPISRRKQTPAAVWFAE